MISTIGCDGPKFRPDTHSGYRDWGIQIATDRPVDTNNDRLLARTFQCHTAVWTQRRGSGASCALEGVCGGGGMAQYILILRIRWRWVVSFKPRRFYPSGGVCVNQCRGWVAALEVSHSCTEMKHSYLQFGHSTETYGIGVPEVLSGDPNITLTFWRRNYFILFF